MKELEHLKNGDYNPDVNTNEWQFVPISIIAPEPIMKDVVSPLIEADAKAGKGLFSNVTDIQDIDEAFDEYLMVEKYGVICSLHPFFNELRSYNIIIGKDSLLNSDLAKALLSFIKEIMCFIKENTNNPNRIQNHIRKVITNFDNIPIWGLLFQILVLRGLCKVIEGININEGDNGFDEVQSLYDWLSERLADKEIQFCYVPYGDKDKQTLKPICNYLYSTELGQAVQNAIFNKQPQQVNNDKTTGDFNLPIELDTEKARMYFTKAIEANYIRVTNNGLQWVFGENKGQARLGYFCNKVYCTPRPINKLEETFGVKKLSSSISNADFEAKRADVKKWRKEIDDKIFND